MNDHSALSESVKEELYKCYPEARRAHLKTGGNFPYLSRPDEVNLFLQVGTPTTTTTIWRHIAAQYGITLSDLEIIGYNLAVWCKYKHILVV